MASCQQYGTPDSVRELLADAGIGRFPADVPRGDSAGSDPGGVRAVF